MPKKVKVYYESAVRLPEQKIKGWLQENTEEKVIITLKKSFRHSFYNVEIPKGRVIKIVF